MKILSTILSLLAMTTIANAQSDISSLVSDWERAKTFTLEYLEAMPADKYNLKPTPEMRTFAQQMLHLTDANYGFTAAATGATVPKGAAGAEKSADQSKASVVKQVTSGYDFVIANLKTMTPEKLSENVTLFGRFEMTKGKALEKLFEHQTHHRGQTTIYIRLAGVTPPNEKLF